jgi:GxxExxY protein
MRPFKALSPDLESLATTLVDCMYKVHVESGAGLLEGAYEKCLAWEIASRGLAVQRQVIVPIIYRGHEIDDGLRIDLLVEQKAIIEVKSVKQVDPVHRAQLMTYLQLTHLQLGFLVNFNVTVIKDGIERFAI